MTTDVRIDCSASMGSRPQRMVVALFPSGGEHRDNIDTNSNRSRCTFIADVAGKLNVDAANLEYLHQEINDAADAADQRADDAAGDSADGERKSQATQLVNLAIAAEAELFHDGDNTAYCRLPVDGHSEVWAVRSRSFKRWLARLYYTHTEKAAGSQAVYDALAVLEGKATFDGDERAVHLRTASHGGRFYLDLCDPTWRAVEVDTNGWRIVDDVPVMFRRSPAMLPLCEPVPLGRECFLVRAFFFCFFSGVSGTNGSTVFSAIN